MQKVKWQVEEESESIKFAKAGEQAIKGFLDGIKDAEKSSPPTMTAVKVLEWLKKYDGKPEMLHVFGRKFYNGVMDLDADEIVRRITAYEAKEKAPKPAEVKRGWLCQVFRDDYFPYMLEKYEMYDVDEETAKKDADDKAMKHAIEIGDPVYAQVITICRVKEDEA